MPPEYADEYCHGPCLQETYLVLKCVDDILSHFVFYNHATIEDVKETLKIGCSDGPHKGNQKNHLVPLYWLFENSRFLVISYHLLLRKSQIACVNELFLTDFRSMNGGKTFRLLSPFHKTVFFHTYTSTMINLRWIWNIITGKWVTYYFKLYFDVCRWFWCGWAHWQGRKQFIEAFICYNTIGSSIFHSLPCVVLIVFLLILICK